MCHLTPNIMFLEDPDCVLIPCHGVYILLETIFLNKQVVDVKNVGTLFQIDVETFNKSRKP